MSRASDAELAFDDGAITRREFSRVLVAEGEMSQEEFDSVDFTPSEPVVDTQEPTEAPIADLETPETTIDIPESVTGEPETESDFGIPPVSQLASDLIDNIKDFNQVQIKLFREPVNDVLQKIAPVETEGDIGFARITARVVAETIFEVTPVTAVEIVEFISFIKVTGALGRVVAQKFPAVGRFFNQKILERQIKALEVAKERMRGELNGLLFRIKRGLGIPQETGLVPFDFKKAVAEGRMTTTQAMRKSEAIFKEELEIRGAGEEAPIGQAQSAELEKAVSELTKTGMAQEEAALKVSEAFGQITQKEAAGFKKFLEAEAGEQAAIQEKALAEQKAKEPEEVLSKAEEVELEKQFEQNLEALEAERLKAAVEPGPEDVTVTPRELTASEKLEIKNVEKAKEFIKEVQEGVKAEDTKAIREQFKKIASEIKTEKLAEDIRENFIKDVESGIQKIKNKELREQFREIAAEQFPKKPSKKKVEIVTGRAGAAKALLTKQLTAEARAAREASKKTKEELTTKFKETLSKIKEVSAEKLKFQKLKAKKIKDLSKAEKAALKEEGAIRVEREKSDILEGKAIQTQLRQFAREALPASAAKDFDLQISETTKASDMEPIFESINKRADRIERREAVGELKKEIKKIDIKKLRPEFKAPIEDILSGLDLKQQTARKMERLTDIAEFMSRNPDNVMPESILRQLDAFARTPVEDLSVDEVKKITDLIKHYAHINKTKNKLILKDKLREFDKARNEAIENVKARHSATEIDDTGLSEFTKSTKIGGLENFVKNTQMNPEYKTEILDGKDNGVIQEILYREPDRGVSKEINNKFESIEYVDSQLPEHLKANEKGLRPIIDGPVSEFSVEGFLRLLKPTNSWSTSFQTKTKNVEQVKIDLPPSVDFPEGRTIEMSKGTRISFRNHSLNQKNMKHLTIGGFSFPSKTTRIVKLNQTDVEAIVDSLTPDELAWSEATWKFFNIFQKQKINEASVRLLGFEIATEDNYYMIRTNGLDRIRRDLIKSGNFTQKTLEGIGILKERVGASGAIIVDDVFVVLSKSVKQISAYVGLSEPLRTAKALLNDKDFQIAVINTGGGHYLRSLKDYIKRIEDSATNLSDIDKMTLDLIRRMDVAILGANLSVIAKQPVSFIVASTEIDIKWLVKSLLGGPNMSKEFEMMKKWHPQLRDRLDGNITREMGELAEVGSVKKMWTGKIPWSQFPMRGIMGGDGLAVSLIWRAVVFEISSTHVGPKNDAFWKKVAERAWLVTRRTQPTFHPKDRSDIGADPGVWMRLWTKYTSQRNKNYMIMGRGIERYNRSKKTPQDKANLAKVMAIMALGTTGIVAVDEIRGKFLGNKEKTTMRSLGLDFLETTLGSVYFVGDIFKAVRSKVERGVYGGFDTEDLMHGAINDLTDTTAELYLGIETFITGEKFKSGIHRDEKKWEVMTGRFLVGLVDLFGLYKGIPLATARRYLGSLHRIVTGEGDPQNKATGRKTGRGKSGR